MDQVVGTGGMGEVPSQGKCASLISGHSEAMAYTVTTASTSRHSPKSNLKIPTSDSGAIPYTRIERAACGSVLPVDCIGWMETRS